MGYMAPDWMMMMMIMIMNHKVLIIACLKAVTGYAYGG
jgi:hypothetical protein